jgi:hypothetical protein
MIIEGQDNLTIELKQAAEKGTPWQVLVFRKFLGLKRRVSCDWFLNEAQAKTFAEQLAKDLRPNGDTMNLLKKRNPGWTFRRPSH